MPGAGVRGLFSGLDSATIRRAIGLRLQEGFLVFGYFIDYYVLIIGSSSYRYYGKYRTCRHYMAKDENYICPNKFLLNISIKIYLPIIYNGPCSMLV
jgi:hypothetical protein